MSDHPKHNDDMDDDENASTVSKSNNTYKRRAPRNVLAIFIIVLFLALCAIGGIVYAVMATHKDPASIRFPEHTTKSLAEESDAQNHQYGMNEEAVVPDAQDDMPLTDEPSQIMPIDDGSDMPNQQEAPLIMSPETVQPQNPDDVVIPDSSEALDTEPSDATSEEVKPETQSLAPFTPLPQASGVDSNKGMVAIVIDDMGLNQRNSQAISELTAPLTLAYLPYAERLPAQTASAYENGHELIVHMPMEPEDVAHNNPGPNALLLSLTAEDITARVRENLTRFDGHVGLNNHMGSKFTANAEAMRAVMQVAKENNMWFLDSKTSDHSQAAHIASEIGVPYASRDVFLDNVHDVQAILRQLRQTETIARKRGYAIAIGHPHTATLEALKIWLPQAKANGITLVSLSTIIAQRFPSAPVPRFARIHKSGKLKATEPNIEPQTAASDITAPQS